MTIKVSIALEFGREQHRDEFLRDLRALLLQQSAAPKYKVAVKMEFGNEELGDQLPLHLPSLGVADDSVTPLEEAIDEASRSGVSMRIIRKA